MNKISASTIHIELSIALFIALFISAPLMPAYAQRDSRHFENGVVSVTNNDTVSASGVEHHLKGNAPQSPKDNGLPRFAIVGTDHKFYMGIGVQFLGEGVFDFGDKMSSPTSFTPASIAPSTPGNGSSLGFGWQTSSFYINIVALPGADNQVGLFFKANFTNNNSLKVKHLYVNYRGLKVGYTTNLFTDASAEPMTIDNEGPNGYPFKYAFTASWTQNFTKNISGAIAIEETTTAMITTKETERINQRIPVIPFYIQYAWNGGKAHSRISGIVRGMQYRDMTNRKNKVLTGLGVQLSGMNPIVGTLSLNYNIVYGRGISTYLQDDAGLNLDAVPVDKAGKLEMVKNLGFTAGLNYKFSSKVTSNIVFSHLINYLPEEAEINTGTYRYGNYIAANVLYSINRFVGAGIEYDYGLRKDLAGETLHTNRLQVQMSVTF